jgi:hypothetical protein
VVGSHLVWTATTATVTLLSGAPGIGVTFTIAALGDGAGDEGVDGAEDGVTSGDATPTDDGGAVELLGSAADEHAARVTIAPTNAMTRGTR